MGNYTLGQLILMIVVSFAVITVPGLMMAAYWSWLDRNARKKGEHLPSQLDEAGTVEKPRKAA